MKWYNKRNAVVVPFKVRKDGYAVCARNRYRKWWVLKNVTFTLGTDPPSRAPTPELRAAEGRSVGLLRLKFSSRCARPGGQSIGSNDKYRVPFAGTGTCSAKTSADTAALDRLASLEKP